MVVSSFAIGALARPVFNLGFVDSALTIIFINLLGIMPVCFFSTFGPRFGLRQMVLSRFYFGFYGVKLSKFTEKINTPETYIRNLLFFLTMPLYSCHIQYPGVYRLVCSQCHSRRTVLPRS